MFANVLIANRGEIACRIIRTARRMGMRTIALHTPADRGALFTRLADETHEIGEGAKGYLDGRRSSRWREVGAQCLHPGYGFLSENADFAEACAKAGHRLRRPAARGDARDGAQKHGQGADAAGRRAGRARLSRRQPEPEIPQGEGLRDRLSRADQGDRGRRRARHAPGRRACRIRGRAGERRRARPRPRSAIRAC